MEWSNFSLTAAEISKGGTVLQPDTVRPREHILKWAFTMSLNLKVALKGWVGSMWCIFVYCLWSIFFINSERAASTEEEMTGCTGCWSLQSTHLSHRAQGKGMISSPRPPTLQQEIRQDWTQSFWLFIKKNPWPVSQGLPHILCLQYG